MTFKRALIWSIFWIGLSLLTSLGVSYYWGSELAFAFLAGYTIEKALSVDNLFVFLMLFSHFHVDGQSQRRVLNYGIIGVLLSRGIIIFAGISLVTRFEWLMYIFGVIVFYTGVVMAFGKEDSDESMENKRIVRWTRKLIPVTNVYHGTKFFVREGAKWLATPLFVVLVVLEVTDVLFSVDSIPAIFSVSRNPYIVYSSNILAVLGLRSLYFLLERMQSAFHHVKKAVGVILWFVGLKMILPLFWHEGNISTLLSLIIIVAILLLGILASVVFPEKKKAS